MARRGNSGLFAFLGLAGLAGWVISRAIAGSTSSSSAPDAAAASTESDLFAPVNPFDQGGAVNVLQLNTLTAQNSSLAQRRQAFAPYFEDSSTRHALPDGLLARQGEVESQLLPTARSQVGAVGIMQLMPRYFPNAGQDPVADIETAAQEMARLFSVFGSWTLALAGYNAGQGNVQSYGMRVPPFPETRAYIAKILPAVGISEPDVAYA